MRLWLLFALVAAVALVASGNHEDLKKLARRREGTSRHRTHRPCSGCFSVLSEESQPMSWSVGEDEEPQPVEWESSRMEEKEPAKPMRHPGRGTVQEVPSTWRGRGGRTQP